LINSYQIFEDKAESLVFASDFHLGVPDYFSSLEREKKIIDWLHTYKDSSIYLIGDLFDFWYEYKHVVPKNYVRILGTLALLRDNGTEIKLFTGNHDLWMFDYFEKELNIPVLRKPIVINAQNKILFVGHGDGLGPDDKGYKLMKKMFTSPLLQWCFSRIHPNFAFGLAHFFSKTSRNAQAENDVFTGEENEWLWQYCKRKSAQMPHIDAFIFGHRHLELDLKVNDKTRYLNTGTWLNRPTFVELKNSEIKLKTFQ
jgi:UDP-2,3-diacylglucosamine hydrolase